MISCRFRNKNKLNKDLLPHNIILKMYFDYWTRVFNTEYHIRLFNILSYSKSTQISMLDSIFFKISKKILSIRYII